MTYEVVVIKAFNFNSLLDLSGIRFLNSYKIQTTFLTIKLCRLKAHSFTELLGQL